MGATERECWRRMAAGSLETWACEMIVAVDTEAYILIASENTP